ncbi:MAG: hypothetical protein PVI54_01270 [Desulfobacteraceae bacterium]|jgi:hypothetical protein
MEKMGAIFLLKELFSLRAATDIILVTAVLRLGTWKIVTGILLAIALFSVASMLDLRGIEWIYSNLSPNDACHKNQQPCQQNGDVDHNSRFTPVYKSS